VLLALPKRRGDEVDNSRSVGMGLHPVGLQFSNKCNCWPMGHVAPWREQQANGYVRYILIAQKKKDVRYILTI